MSTKSSHSHDKPSQPSQPSQPAKEKTFFPAKPAPAPAPVPAPVQANPAQPVQPANPAPEVAVVPKPPQDQTRADVQAEKDELSQRIAALKKHLVQNPNHGILIRQREAMLALEAILDERLRTGELD